jgi:hypothetical protein
MNFHWIWHWGVMLTCVSMTQSRLTYDNSNTHLKLRRTCVFARGTGKNSPRNHVKYSHFMQSSSIHTSARQHPSRKVTDPILLWCQWHHSQRSKVQSELLIYAYVSWLLRCGVQQAETWQRANPPFLGPVQGVIPNAKKRAWRGGIFPSI